MTRLRRGSRCTLAVPSSPSLLAAQDRHHPYAVPCVIAVPIVDGNPAYVNWVLNETANGGAVEQ